MAHRYTDEEKNAILARLDDNFGNVALTALQMDIPIRTLQDWKRLRKLQALRDGEPVPGNPFLPRKKVDARRRQQQEQSGAHHDAPVPTDEEAQTDDPVGEYTRIRERLMDHINNLIETLTDDPDTAHLRIIALTRLLDRVIKLEALVGKEGEQVIRVEYKYPDGSIHNRPPWEDPDHVAEQARQLELHRQSYAKYDFTRLHPITPVTPSPDE